MEVTGKQSTMQKTKPELCHKSKLNQLCQKNKWGPPKYSCINQGLNHNPLFKASVVVNGATFASQSIFKSSKLAHNDVASLALSHLTPSRDVSKTGDVCLPEEKAVTTASPLTHTSLSVKESDPKECMENYLLCNKVRVYTSIPDKVLPKGTVMLPIGQDKWTFVSLDLI